MPKWLLVLNGCLLSILIGSWISISWLGVLEFQKTEPEFLSFIRDTHSDINTTFDNVNRGCGLNKPCGTLADLNQTLHTVRGTSGQVEVLLRSVNRNQDIFFNQEVSLYTHADKTFSSLDKAVGKTSTAIDNFIPVEDKLSTTFDSVNTEFAQLNRTNRDINSYLEGEYFQGTTKNLYTISTSMGEMSTDIASKTHEFLYPAPCQGRLCVFKRIYTTTRDIGPLVQPFYYGISAFESLKNGQRY